MKADSVAAVFRSLAAADVRFLVAGGIAVNVYGYMRMTLDVDVIVDLAPVNVNRVFAALESAGYRPTVPVTASDLGDPAVREGLVRDRNMRVLRFHSDAHWQTPVDVFAFAPFDFDEEYGRATVRDIDGVPVRIISLAALLALKTGAGRPQDLADVAKLREVHEPDAG